MVFCGYISQTTEFYGFCTSTSYNPLLRVTVGLPTTNCGVTWVNHRCPRFYILEGPLTLDFGDSLGPIDYDSLNYLWDHIR